MRVEPLAQMRDETKFPYGSSHPRRFSLSAERQRNKILLEAGVILQSSCTVVIYFLGSESATTSSSACSRDLGPSEGSHMDIAEQAWTNRRESRKNRAAGRLQRAAPCRGRAGVLMPKDRAARQAGSHRPRRASLSGPTATTGQGDARRSVVSNLFVDHTLLRNVDGHGHQMSASIGRGRALD
ncbi:hypothetical protein RJ55_04407 [Drechmeria coniospora]|nr:hypothetical protein RJ55_04407 [Drechmeria coniospora]